MASPAVIRQALADALSTIPSAGQTSPYNLPNPTMPCLLVIGHDEINYGNLAFGRHDTEWNMIVRGYVSSQTSSIRAQEILDDWLADAGTDSVKAAIEADQTLGGVAIQGGALVIRSSGSNIFQLENTVSALGTDFLVRVQTAD